jgi:hypothetical protein
MPNQFLRISISLHPTLRTRLKGFFLAEGGWLLRFSKNLEKILLSLSRYLNQLKQKISPTLANIEPK